MQQFAIFSSLAHIFTKPSDEERIEKYLKTKSHFIQFISANVLEQMKTGTKLWDLVTAKKDFANVAFLHEEKCYDHIERMNVEEAVKRRMMKSVSGVSAELTDLINVRR